MLAVVAVSSISVVAFGAALLHRELQANTVDIGDGTTPPQIGAFDGGFNVLVVGTDNDKNQGAAYGERGEPLNDVNILLHVSRDHRSAVVVSFPRDLLVDVPECANSDTGEVSEFAEGLMLNAVYQRGGENGGLGCVVTTIESLTGLEIAFAGTISFAGVIEMSNAVGGVPVCVLDDVRDATSGLELSAGWNTISGHTALAFLRTRHGVADGSDLGRIASQQQYMASLMRVMRSQDTLTNPVKLYGLAQATVQNTRLSASLGRPDSIVSLALALKEVDLAAMTFVQYPGVTANGRVIADRERADELFRRIAADAPVLLDDGALGEYSEIAPGAQPATPTPTRDPAGQDSTSDPENPPTDDRAHDVLDGVLGTTADQQTCARAN